MKVTATREHRNAFGENYEKAVGDSYSLPDDEGERLIRRGLVEKAADDAEKKGAAAKTKATDAPPVT